ncbi:hypothetical protein C4577_05760 [Candidatus Parcubacteria bacterium]|nr:MAG: hypothetical protein C4577_05760 [Candidatus Parcubacteria bacterium]
MSITYKESIGSCPIGAEKCQPQICGAEDCGFKQQIHTAERKCEDCWPIDGNNHSFVLIGGEKTTIYPDLTRGYCPDRECEVAKLTRVRAEIAEEITINNGHNNGSIAEQTKRVPC